MKKIISILSCALALTLVSSCNWFELDNQEGWDASVEGQILDAGTNQPIQFAQGFSAITVVEKGWKAQTNQSWAVKNNGSYKNALVFSGQYTMNTLSNNFIAEPQDFILQKGDNKVNFNVLPFVRVENVQWAMEGKKIKVTCKVSSPVAAVNNIGEVRLCVAKDRFVSMNDNACDQDPASFITDVDPSGTTVTLYVDPDYTNLATGAKPNAQEFQYDQPHFVRIAAIGAHYTIIPAWTEEVEESVFDMDAYAAAGYPDDWWNYFVTVVTIIEHPASYSNDGTVNSAKAYNYSPVYKLDLKAGTFTEVTDW